jgi:hypothetical protein
MLHRSRLVLALCVLLSGLFGQECPLMVRPQANSVAVGPPPPIQPLDKTKIVVSASASPTVLVRTLAPATLSVQAVIAFNASLDRSSVRVHDITPGQTPVTLGSLSPAGITPLGQLFRGDISVNGASSRRLQVSAAYFGDPRRARSQAFDVPVISPPRTAVFVEQAVIRSASRALVADRVIVDLFADVGEAEAEDLADDVGATIVGFSPVSNIYIFEYPIDPIDPGAEAQLRSAIAELLAFGDLVERAFPSLLLSSEAVDFDALSADDKLAFDAANIPDAWLELPSALSANGIAGAPHPVRIGVIDAGLEVGDFSTVVNSPLGADPHADLDFDCTTDGNDPTCPVYPPFGPHRSDLREQQINATNGAHNADSACPAGSNCAMNRRRIDHGNFVTGVIGAVNHDGRSGLGAQGSNGVLAFASGATGAAANGPSQTGSDLSYQILFAKALDTAEMITQIDELATLPPAQVPQVILLPFGVYDGDVIASCPTDPEANLADGTDFADTRDALRDMIAAHSGILFVASAGNCASPAVNHAPGGMPSPPDNLISVGATNPATNAAASFSNTGTTVDVAAPGVGVPGPIGYTDQGPAITACAPPGDLECTIADTVTGRGAGSGTAAIRTGNGTSASAALVAGVAGLHLAVSGGTLTPAVLKSQLKLSNVAAGAGLVNVPRLDALRVVQATVAKETDIAILVDTTGSFIGDLVMFKAQASDMLGELQNSGLDVSVALAQHKDFPVGIFGATSDFPYRRELVPGTVGDPTPLHVLGTEYNVDELSLAINGLTGGGGFDDPESQLEALHQLATGTGNVTYTPLTGQGGVSGDAGVVRPAFRSTSENRFVVLWTDASFHDSADEPTYPGPTFDSVCAALDSRDINVITILAPPFSTDDAAARADVARLAGCSNSCVPEGVSVDCNGDGTVDLEEDDPFVCEIDANGEQIANAIVSTVRAAASGPVPCP